MRRVSEPWWNTRHRATKCCPLCGSRGTMLSSMSLHGRSGGRRLSSFYLAAHTRASGWGVDHHDVGTRLALRECPLDIGIGLDPSQAFNRPLGVGWAILALRPTDELEYSGWRRQRVVPCSLRNANAPRQGRPLSPKGGRRCRGPHTWCHLKQLVSSGATACCRAPILSRARRSSVLPPRLCEDGCETAPLGDSLRARLAFVYFCARSLAPHTC